MTESVTKKKGRPQGLLLDVGSTFGKWTVIGPKEVLPKATVYLCRCECGTDRKVTYTGLASGKSRSCGCMVAAAARAKATHGDSIRGKTTPYPTWQGMKTRCTNPNIECYKHYGGRGITVCPEWLASYETFRAWCDTHGWKPGLELDRIDTNGNYCPENCRWITHAVNMSNCRNSRHITAWGEIKAISEWAADPRCTVSRAVLSDRLKKNLWSAEQVISTRFMPLGPRPH